jgi:hypothetical protein
LANKSGRESKRMARRKRRQRRATAAVEGIGLHEAAILLDKLHELGHVTVAHLREARNAVAREVEEIVARLAQLKEFAHVPVISQKPPKSVPTVVAHPARPAVKRPRKRTQAPVSAERRKIMQLQGRYLGLMHKVPKAELAKFKADIPKVGKAEVVKRMEAYVRKHQTKGGDGPFPVKSVGARKRAKAKAKRK